MRTVNRHSTGLRLHMAVYTALDARLDNPHTPAGELARIVALARSTESCPHLRRQRMNVCVYQPPLRGRVAARA